jgi:hypothetical protein
MSVPDSHPRPERALASEYVAALEQLGACPHCGKALAGRPNRCPHCKKLLGEAAHDLKRVAVEERRLERGRKNAADILFLAGLLGGGPPLSLAGRTGLGLFVLLAGGVASAIYRYTRSSPGGSLLIAGLGAAVVAAAVAIPGGGDTPEDAQADEAARTAYVGALARDVEAAGGVVEARGPGQITVWFELPTETGAECGGYPDPTVREHLAQLGFVRIVVASPTERAGVCSFRP